MHSGAANEEDRALRNDLIAGGGVSAQWMCRLTRRGIVISCIRGRVACWEGLVGGVYL